MSSNPECKPSDIYTAAEKDTITLLRVISTLLVLLIHITIFVDLPGVLGQIAAYGADGVNIFSMLTGFLVMNSWHDRTSTKEYWHKRIRRLLPLYYFILILLIVVKWDWFLQEPFSIPRALLLLNYIVPSKVDYNYSGLWLLGTIPIFMTFYVLIPLISKCIKKLEGALILFIGATLSQYLILHLYIHFFGNAYSVTTMTGYFMEKLLYFLAGVMVFYGKRYDRVWQMLLYQLFIMAAGMRYSFLNLSLIGTLPLLVAILLCFPIALPNCMIKPLRWVDSLGMGVLVVQFHIFEKLYAVFAHTEAISPKMQFFSYLGSAEKV